VDIKGHSLLGGTLKDFWSFPSDYQNCNYLTCVHVIFHFISFLFTFHVSCTAINTTDLETVQ
jgi:hypothetical protein